MDAISGEAVLRRRVGKEGSSATNEEDKHDENEVTGKLQFSEEEEDDKSKSAEQKEGDKEYEIIQGSHWLTRITYLRSIAFIYAVAFLVAYHQNKQLIGDKGLLPLKMHMESLKKYSGDSWWKRIISAPTLLWLAEPWTQVNEWLDVISILGVGLSSFVIWTGGANVFIMISLWILYHSLVNVGQRWYGFGWESQLLETGFLGVLMVPVFNVSPLPSGTPSPSVGIMGLRWLLFRIMMGAGLIKIRGDKCWHDLTCMNYHYQTQPVPNPMAYYLHQSPEWWHMTETFGNHIVELIVPFFAFLPRGFQIACGIIQIMFQVMLIISGNLSFLNWLTIVPSIAFFDDKTLSGLFSKTVKKKVAALQRTVEDNAGIERKLFNGFMYLFIGYLSLPVVINLLSSHQAMNTSFDPFRLVNTYGAFGSVTKVRSEVIFEGTHASSLDLPSVVWHEYEFNCKPGNTSRTPCLISPYHYRLDWLMWFAGFQSYEHNPWLLHLAGKFLVNDEEASSLIHYNPFKDQKPPRFVRALHYVYEYTKVGSPEAAAGHWYKRVLKGNFLPPVDIQTLKPFFKRVGWRTL
ncbi:lipase maturation factor 1-like [Oratosquilla oratoria]|uniref:lipase maturation factor 1-like n=1 Tax=Oratosquilla oratoria TaxID=337810 RepID=UPI003F761027